ncbi:hypothetical protein GGI07_005437 [Coemansia sp. Benny D115]|nr:hypothetical protein GGI07_005437 [Coemansia sp. Benny D115]
MSSDSGHDTARPVGAADGALQADAVADFERAGCPEFFQGRAQKTPERYLAIRNHIMGEWQRVRPQYLTKIRARSGLRNCGDVNAIGRVHTFLEALGLINQGAQQPPRRSAPRVKARRVHTSDGEPDIAARIFASDSDDDRLAEGRRRRQQHARRAPTGGHVIAHDDAAGGDADGDFCYLSDSASSDGERARRYMSNSEFRLVACRAFAPAPPFELRISAAALALMDLHAHLTHAEVIGLLGGRISGATIHVDVAFACAGAGTATECEMDAQAEVSARRQFAQHGRLAVGWFHSHPAFEATPSVRDIATQRAYQALSRAADGSEPFVGAIVSPPGDEGGPYGVSSIRVFAVPADSPAQPFACPYHVDAADAISPELLDEMELLVRTQAQALDHVCRADLARRFRRNEATTALEKLLISLRSHWAPDARQQWDDAVSQRLRPLLEQLFCRRRAGHGGS